MIELDGDPQVMRFINGGRAPVGEEVAQEIAKALGARWLGIERETGKFVGWYSLRESGGREYEIGCRLKREHGDAVWPRKGSTTMSSWLNLVERWFRKLTDKAIRRGVFHSVPDLITGIEEYLKATNDNPKPFVWTATDEAILEKVRGRVSLNAITG